MTPTRLLERDDLEPQPTPKAPASSVRPKQPAVSRDKRRGEGELLHPVVGWLAVIGGPGRGRILSLHPGINALGRGPNAKLRVDFGDRSIAFEEHAKISYDPTTRRFLALGGDEGAAFAVNGVSVIGPVALAYGDTLVVGQTLLRFVPLCGVDFDWQTLETP
ncbi:MAG: FHA domain-containing protein [Candidatus Competibacterales bacterium]